MAAKVKVGIVGTGNICKAYVLTAQSFPILEVVALADINMDVAKARAAELNVPRALSVEQLLADPEIEIVVNLTIPKAHAPVALAALAAGKHVYNEKPLAVSLEDGAKIVEQARARKLRVGCAPGTFLGGGLQTCRKLIDDGVIGQPIGASAFMMCPGHERWHPNPEFFYEAGGGPMMDMGPYYITTLLNLLGPVRRVTGSATVLKPDRTITSEPKKGKKIDIQTPDHISGVIDFVSGAVATITTTFAAWHSTLPNMEIYGTLGTLLAPDPNSLGGPIRLKLADDKEWREVPLSFGHEGPNKWGIGVAEMAPAIRSGRGHRATGQNALHALEVMHAFLTAPQQGRHVIIQAPYERPQPLPPGLPQDALE